MASFHASMFKKRICCKELTLKDVYPQAACLQIKFQGFELADTVVQIGLDCQSEMLCLIRLLRTVQVFA